MNLFKLLSIYLISYYFWGAMFFLFLFGSSTTLNILLSSPFDGAFSGAVILFSAFLASLIVITLMKKRLLSLPYPYFMLGFYIGNASLLIMFALNGLLHGDVIWKFPEVFLIILAPFMTLILSYIAGFVFWALIPSLLSAYILFKVVQFKNKANA